MLLVIYVYVVLYPFLLLTTAFQILVGINVISVSQGILHLDWALAVISSKKIA